jgi:hypothetical protein
MFPFAIIGLVKILKKYDKRTGAIQLNTELLYHLVEECEAMLNQVLPY